MDLYKNILKISDNKPLIRYNLKPLIPIAKAVTSFDYFDPLQSFVTMGDNKFMSLNKYFSVFTN